MGGVRRCYTCSAGTPHQLPGGGDVVCLGCACPGTHTWLPRWYCLVNDRLDAYVLSRIDAKLFGLFLDHLQILGCLPACPLPPPVIQPPQVVNPGKR